MHERARKHHTSASDRAVTPNTSLNLRANGMPQSPRHSAGVHYLWRGLCVTPSSPG
jgi:hypothetical protein